MRYSVVPSTAFFKILPIASSMATRRALVICLGAVLGTHTSVLALDSCLADCGDELSDLCQRWNTNLCGHLCSEVIAENIATICATPSPSAAAVPASSCVDTLASVGISSMIMKNLADGYCDASANIAEW